MDRTMTVRLCEPAASKSVQSRAAAAWRVLGPGFVTGSSDHDPSGMATYSQTGAQFEYSQLWCRRARTANNVRAECWSVREELVIPMVLPTQRQET
jgi:hypothetical protein